MFNLESGESFGQAFYILRLFATIHPSSAFNTFPIKRSWNYQVGEFIVREELAPNSCIAKVCILNILFGREATCPVTSIRRLPPKSREGAPRAAGKGYWAGIPERE